ncbi:hypothetical protein TR51_13950 [Kitasatospora griseola]|uniref:Uncharacterized protein n=1 Tax=Kitasatospora griseola TaxID=2064 RepID=A0A0D0P0Q4_KITGR|nr:hypothetical protein [Kitasatospora griseola]KIQ65116.1 hypothetical protein TR51_13950 [Kitasatospora griseola]
MTTSLLALVRGHAAVADYFRWPGELDLTRTEHVEPVHLASGLRLEAFAGDGGGGTYFFCGEGGEGRPILFADSEGGATLLAVGLPELLRLLLAAPWWRDCPTCTAEESDQAAVEYLEDEPALLAARDTVAATLGLTYPTAAEALARLHLTATGIGREFDLIHTPEGTSYRTLIG